MRTKPVLAMLMLSAATLTLNFSPAEAANVDVNISGFLPAPPGVVVQVDAGRPYYVQNDRRVFMERRPDKHRKHYKEKHRDNGKKKGHYKDEGNGGHGEGGHGGGHGH